MCEYPSFLPVFFTMWDVNMENPLLQTLAWGRESDTYA